MDISGPYILIRVYLDAFAVNSPIGSSSNNHKIMGFYYSPFVNLVVASRRSTVQTIGLIFQRDIDHFGLNTCLKNPISQLKSLVNEGFYDNETKRTFQVRVICSLGDNLEQNHVCGLRQNFSSMPHPCRKCMCSLRHLKLADNYEEIHSKNHIHRTDEMMFENFQESQEKNVIHINGVGGLSLYYQFPYFNSSKQLPQCSSHDYLEGCAKLWLKIIFEKLVKDQWFSWEALENVLLTFPYRGTDANSRPAILRAKKMKIKTSRKVIGTFAEVSTLIRSLTQLLYNHLKDVNNPFWQWFLQIRQFLRYMQMPKISDTQIDEMDSALISLMNTRLKLTKISVAKVDDNNLECDNSSCNDAEDDKSDEISDDESSDTSGDEEVINNLSKYDPPVRYKEHALSHLPEDIRNLAPLPLLNTDLFESIHSPYKNIRHAKRSSVNILYTLTSQHEYSSVYHSTGDMIPTPIEKTIVRVSEDNRVQKYMKNNKIVGGAIYECSKMSIFGTVYKAGQFVILPSTNDCLAFGKIIKLLSCEFNAYFLYKKTIAVYCSNTDLYMIHEHEDYDIIPSHHLADFRPLQGYLVGEEKKTSISLRNYILDQ